MLCDPLFEIDNTIDSKKTLIIFDTSWVSYAAATASIYSNFTFNHKFTGHIFGSMAKILSSFKAYGKSDISNTELIFVFDEYPDLAYELYPEYKKGRIKTLNPIPDIKNMVNLFSCHQAYAPRTEADHVIGTIANKYCTTHKIYIISADKDLWQLLDLPNVYITPRLKEYATKKSFEKKFGIKNVSGIALHKAIFGDASDNIPKLQGSLRHKVIKKYIDISDGTPSSFYSLLENKPEDMKDSVYTILMNNKEWVKRIYRLTKLQTDIEYKITDNSLDVDNVNKLLDFLHNYGIKKFDSKVEDLFYPN